MAPLRQLATALLLPLLASAHFNLNAPATIGFEEDQEATGPCGGFSPDFSKNTVTDFHVGGDAVAVRLGHPQATWLFRGTLDQTGASNWTQLFPIVRQSGLGLFCEPAIAVPESWAGKKGIIGVVADAPDGLLYQCAAVNFVTGTGTPGSTCTNGTLTADFVDDDKLTPLVGASSGSSSNTTTTPSSTTSGAAASSTAASTSHSASASATGNAAAQLAPGAAGFAGSLVTVAAMVLAGAAYVL